MSNTIDRTKNMLEDREAIVRAISEQRADLLNLEYKITTRILKDGNPNLLKVDWAKAERYYRSQ